ncbi:MAG: twin-arginine translocase subunit TatC [Gammaproteobacteria bacterium]|nr:twin-arginine translocase subunit TatC [Gammaproteobacteria bacterium]
MSKESSTAEEAQPESFVSHLIELRDRLLRSVIVVLIVFVPAAIFSGKLFTLLAAPMLSALSGDSTMISTEVAGPFLVPLKFAFALSIAVAIPYLLFQIWSFIAPGLYENEKRLAFPLLLSSTLLFYCGIAFAYFVVFPIMFGFFPSVAPEGIEVTPDINHYLGFVLKLFFAFGIAFEMPIATILLIKAGITTREKLAKKRQYVVLGAFVVGMLLTPPDIFSQTMLAIPMWLLFELGLIMSKFVGGPKKPDDEDPDDDPEGGGDSAMKKTAAKSEVKSTASDSKKTESSDEEDVVSPATMAQQANYDASDDADVEEEEDLDKLAEEMDELEDITDWVQQEDKPAKKVVKKTTKKTKKVKKSVKTKKKKSKKAKKAVKTKKSSKTKKIKK